MESNSSPDVVRCMSNSTQENKGHNLRYSQAVPDFVVQEEPEKEEMGNEEALKLINEDNPFAD